MHCHSIENNTVGTTLQPPILALEYVSHLTLIKGWVGRHNNDGVGGGTEIWALRAHKN